MHECKNGIGFGVRSARAWIRFNDVYLKNPLGGEVQEDQTVAQPGSSRLRHSLEKLEKNLAPLNLIMKELGGQCSCVRTKQLLDGEPGGPDEPGVDVPPRGPCEREAGCVRLGSNLAHGDSPSPNVQSLVSIHSAPQCITDEVDGRVALGRDDVMSVVVQHCGHPEGGGDTPDQLGLHIACTEGADEFGLKTDGHTEDSDVVDASRLVYLAQEGAQRSSCGQGKEGKVGMSRLVSQRGGNLMPYLSELHNDAGRLSGGGISDEGPNFGV